jgi:AraC family transcriptional regulator of adaptative response / DNA-3-methyladenine glycosylase II
VDREGVGGLAARLHFSERQLNRILVSELGAGPVALARAQRAQTARTLIQSTDLPFGQVALGAGFRSVRQFNDTVRAVYARTPTELRRRARSSRAASGAIRLRLPYREPFDGDSLLAFLAERAIAGVEELDGSTYRRSLSLDHGAGIVSLTPAARFVRCELHLDDLRDLTAAVARSRRLLDLDADPVSISSQLGQDGPLAPLVRERPGLRVPGCVDGFELAVRAIVGQQVSVPAARTVLGRLAATYGEPLPEPDGRLTHRFPSAGALAEAEPGALPSPRTRAMALRSLARLSADGELSLDAGTDSAEALGVLTGIPGVGPWTAAYVAMRALGDPDMFLPGDAGVRHALTRLGGRTSDEQWRPWRSYAVMHLWRSLAA